MNLSHSSSTGNSNSNGERNERIMQARGLVLKRRRKDVGLLGKYFSAQNLKRRKIPTRFAKFFHLGAGPVLKFRVYSSEPVYELLLNFPTPLTR